MQRKTSTRTWYLEERKAAALAAGLVAMVLSAPVQAEQAASYPNLTGELAIEIADDLAFDSEDPTAEINDLYATIEPALSLRFSESLSLEFGGVLEPVRDPEPNEDRVFEDHDLYVEQLFLNYEGEMFGFWAGKFNPSFGTAWDIGPGIYGVDFAEDYELTERLGLGGAVTFGDDRIGEHRLAVNAFFVDTTELSRSIGHLRPQTEHSDGGLGNQSITLNGSIPGIEGLSYHLGWSRQQAEDGGATLDETGYVGGLAMEVDLGNGWGVQPMVEAALLQQAGGARQDNTYVTAGTGITYGNWNAAVAGALRLIDPVGAPDTDDTLAQFSLGYAFDNGLGVDVGYRYGDEGDISSHTVGLRLTYAIEFGLP